MTTIVQGIPSSSVPPDVGQAPHWFAVLTRAKSEKFVQRHLVKKGIQAYVPLLRLLRRYTRSTRVVEKPLIPGYIFVRITRPEFIPVLETEHVVGFVKFNQVPVPIPEQEIDLLRRITLEDGLDVRVVREPLTMGDRIEITAGNLAGMRGQVVKMAGKRHFQVALEYLGCSLLMTIDAAFLAKTGTV